jgi:hypothetical protein
MYRERKVNLNLSHDAILSNRCVLRKGPEISLLWARQSHSHDAVKCYRFVSLVFCCVSDAILMVPIWKRK